MVERSGVEECPGCATESHSRPYVPVDWLPQKSIAMTRAEEAERRDLGKGKAQR
jgi:hypothetical protein